MGAGRAREIRGPAQGGVIDLQESAAGRAGVPGQGRRSVHHEPLLARQGIVGRGDLGRRHVAVGFRPEGAQPLIALRRGQVGHLEVQAQGRIAAEHHLAVGRGGHVQSL